MARRLITLVAVCALALLAATTTLAAPVPKTAAAVSPVDTPILDTTFTINVVFVGYEAGDINLGTFAGQLPTTYDPIVRYPAFYGINVPVNIHGDYAFNNVFAPTSFEDAFFSYLASSGSIGPLTAFQDSYNGQVNKSLTIPADVLYIDALETERWLMTHGRSDLGLDVGNYTIFFVNWYSRPDFQFHVYTRTDWADPDTGYNFGVLRGSRKIIAWGGTFGRTWFYDLSAGPESWTGNWNVDDADVDGDGVLDYRMPPVWEYGNVSGYRPFNDLSGDLGKVARWVTIDLLFTTSPLYDPLVSEPYPGKGKKVFVNMLQDDPKSNGLDWIDKEYVQKSLSMFEPDYKWSMVLKDQPLKGGARKAFRIFAGVKTADDCWNAYGDTFAELFCYFDANRNSYLPKPKAEADYVGGIFAFNTKAKKLGSQLGLLGFADDDWMSGTPSYVFEFDSAYYRSLGYGFSTTTVHEFGHHIGMSHPHDGYDSGTGIDFGPAGDYYFAWSGDESNTIMHYLDLSGTFGWFDADNMNRFMVGRYLTRASEIAAGIKEAGAADEARALLDAANAKMDAARRAYRQMDYARAATEARGAFDRVFRAAENAGLNVPIVEPLSGGGPMNRPKMVDPIRFPDN